MIFHYFEKKQNFQVRVDQFLFQSQLRSIYSFIKDIKIRSHITLYDPTAGLSGMIVLECFDLDSRYITGEDILCIGVMKLKLCQNWTIS